MSDFEVVSKCLLLTMCSFPKAGGSSFFCGILAASHGQSGAFNQAMAARASCCVCVR